MKKITWDKLKEGDIIKIYNTKRDEELVGICEEGVGKIATGNYVKLLVIIKSEIIKIRSIPLISGDVLYKLSKEEYMIESL